MENTGPSFFHGEVSMSRGESFVVGYITENVLTCNCLLFS